MSLHLTHFPNTQDWPQEAELIADMDRVRDACNALLSVRSKENIRVRQPLAKATLYGAGAERLKQFSDVIQDEGNVKAVEFSDDLSQIAEHKLKLHNQVLGKRLPAKMKQIIPAAKRGEWELVSPSSSGLSIAGETLLPEEYDLQLQPKEGVTGAAALSTNDALLVLDLEITPELEREGLARDIVRMVQEARKTADLHVSNRIALQFEISGKIKEAIENNKRYIKEQVLAKTLQLQTLEAEHVFEQVLEEETVKFGFSVV
jgi:isoleucyl-tRNA synthetase